MLTNETEPDQTVVSITQSTKENLPEVEQLERESHLSEEESEAIVGNNRLATKMTGFILLINDKNRKYLCCFYGGIIF